MKLIREIKKFRFGEIKQAAHQCGYELPYNMDHFHFHYRGYKQVEHDLSVLPRCEIERIYVTLVRMQGLKR